MIWAQLGAIVLESLHSPTSSDTSRETSIARHSVIMGKERLQRTGEGLEELKLSFRLHPRLGPVRARLDALDAAQLSRDPLPYVLGSGRVIGRYIITKVERSIIETHGNGEPFEVIVTLSLLEWNSSTSRAQSTSSARSESKPVAVTKPPAVSRDLNAPISRTAPPGGGPPDTHPFVPASQITQWPYR